ncbi:MAG: VWA domain-containing protein [Nitrososphaera sp.]|nr:VWA domain-containing protein [Nitrososphaera sp.]
MSILEEQIEIANPAQPHNATVLLLDISGSMAGEKISALNEGLKLFKKEVSDDELASKRVEVAVVGFGNCVSILRDFSSIDDFDPPELHADGLTPMGEGILRAADLLEQRKEQYRARGIDYYRPWIFMITDGDPTDMQPGDSRWSEVIKRVHTGEASKKFMFFAVAVEAANTALLAQIAPPNRPPIKLKERRFRELFEWLSKSQSKVSASKVGEQVALENPIAAGWGEISV